MVPDQDYFFTLSSVAGIKIFRLLMALAALLNLSIVWCDVKNSFIQGDMDVPIWMKAPPDFLTKEQLRAGYALRVVKSLYGAKQAAAIWEKTYEKALTALGFYRMRSTSCLFSKKVNDCLIITAVHVDDSLWIGNLTDIQFELSQLQKVFDLLIEPESSQGLGMRIVRDRCKSLVHLSNPVMIDDLLSRFGCHNAKGKTTPASTSSLYEALPTCSEGDCNLPFKELTGGLQYLAHTCRPDIAYAVGALSQYSSCFSKSHYRTAPNILLYLKSPKDLGVVLEDHRISSLHLATIVSITA